MSSKKQVTQVPETPLPVRDKELRRSRVGAGAGAAVRTDNVSTKVSEPEVLKPSATDKNTVPTQGTGVKSAKVTTVQSPNVSPIQTPRLSKDKVNEKAQDTSSSGSSLGGWADEVDKIKGKRIHNSDNDSNLEAKITESKTAYKGRLRPRKVVKYSK